MKKKIRCINIDGIEGNIKTYVLRELSKYLKNKELDFFVLKNTSKESLCDQEGLLKNNDKHLILKENSLISLYRDEIIKGNGITYLKQNYEDLLVEEQKINHSYGCVYFLLISEDPSLYVKKDQEEHLSVGLKDCHHFLKNIKNYTVAQHLDIKIILYNENDKIFDIKDKIINILEKEYN